MFLIFTVQVSRPRVGGAGGGPVVQVSRAVGSVAERLGLASVGSCESDPGDVRVKGMMRSEGRTAVAFSPRP